MAKLLDHGDTLLRSGDVASARLFYERAAGAGDGRAALRLGATFDPEFLGRLGLGQLQANPAEARSWYNRARDLGMVDAKPRLNSLETRLGK
jgi:TPR repeat protein